MATHQRKAQHYADQEQEEDHERAAEEPAYAARSGAFCPELALELRPPLPHVPRSPASKSAHTHLPGHMWGHALRAHCGWETLVVVKLAPWLLLCLSGGVVRVATAISLLRVVLARMLVACLLVATGPMLDLIRVEGCVLILGLLGILPMVGVWVAIGHGG